MIFSDCYLYYVSVNDDTEMLSPGWTDVYINALQVRNFTIYHTLEKFSVIFASNATVITDIDPNRHLLCYSSASCWLFTYLLVMVLRLVRYRGCCRW